MAKRNKIRYQSKPKDKPRIQLTGKVYLQYVDDEALEKPQRGDMLVYPYNDALTTTRQGDYDSTGFSGYFKVDVFEGNVWCPILVHEIFTQREHHFSKTECPIDTYHLCEDMLLKLAGTWVVRTYREHYVPEEIAETIEPEKS